MQKYAKHFLGAIGGSGLTVAGVLMWQIVTAGFDWDRVSRYGFGDQIGHCGTWPFAVIGTIMIVVGVFFIIIPIFNLLSRE